MQDSSGRGSRDAFSGPGASVPALRAIGAERLPLDEADVRVWRMPLEASDEQLAALAQVLSAEERGRMDGFQPGTQRRRFAVAHGALRLLLAHHLEREPDQLAFATGIHGKPHLTPPAALEFNLTHARELALIALSCRGAVGIDVEDLARKPFDLRPMVQRVLSEAEKEWLGGVAEAVRRDAFLQLWAAKEAVSKASGKGFTAGFARIRIEPDRLALGEPQEVRAAGGCWRLHVLAPGPGYVGALAVAA